MRAYPDSDETYAIFATANPKRAVAAASPQGGAFFHRISSDGEASQRRPGLAVFGDYGLGQSRMTAVSSRINLVVVRGGDSSLHERWLAPDRSWDLVVSYFGVPRTAHVNAEWRPVYCPGGKWEGLYDLFASNPHLLDEYEYVWLPDDDIDADCRTIDEMFLAMKRHELWLAQPSLDPGSYFHHHITVTNPAFQLRYTNFIELMVPCFKSEFLRGLVPLFAGRRFGWGLDWVWAYLMEQPSLKAAVIDECAVTHSRPYQIGSLYTDDGAPDPEEEAKEFLESLEISQPPASFVYAGLTLGGTFVTGLGFSALMAVGGGVTAARVRHIPIGYTGFYIHLLMNCVSRRGRLGPPPFKIEGARLSRTTRTPQHNG